MKMRITGILVLFSLTLNGQVNTSVAKATDSGDPFIRWIAAIPSGAKQDSVGFFEKIFNLIAGNDPVVYNAPVGVLANGLSEFRIVNQGDGTILDYSKGKTTIVSAFRKSENRFPSIVAFCAIKQSGILFTDSKLNKIYLLSDDGKKISLFSGDNVLNRPTGIAFSEITDEIWVVETGSHQISVFNRKGERKKTIGRRGNGQIEFNFPTYIWIDSMGRIYIVDSMNFRVQILSANGDFLSSFGRQGDATGHFARPRGIATDSQGNIYVADALFDVVQIFDTSGRLLYYFGTHGSGKNQFWMPSGLYIDKNDYIYVSDSYNSRIQIFQFVKNIKK
jgi:DNA-binding beta-propeller fold protein YncE